MEAVKITIKATINAPIEKVWQFWSKPEHIMKWCNASDDWGVPHAENDLRTGGQFTTTMAAKDGSASFDFGGVYTNVEENKSISYTIHDGRKVDIVFTENGNETNITETFEAENTNTVGMQRAGWQAILDNFKSYAETH